MKKKNYTNKEIKGFNEYFNSLTPAKKRVAIAKDVIANIESKKYFAKMGNYLYVNSDDNLESQSLQKVLPQVTCNVCALGAMFVSDVKFNNNFNVGDDTLKKLDNQLSKYFSKGQLALIEAAFEGFGVDYEEYEEDELSIENGFYLKFTLEQLGIKEQDVINAKKFYAMFDTSEENLIAIMENIIKNKGKFKP
jgi:hypothetical protein